MFIKLRYLITNAKNPITPKTTNRPLQMNFLFLCYFSVILTEITISVSAQMNSSDTNHQNLLVANDAAPPPLSSIQKRFIGNINVSAECYIGVLPNGCIYLCGNNPRHY